jgi:hypothetical protein
VIWLQDYRKQPAGVHSRQKKYFPMLDAARQRTCKDFMYGEKFDAILMDAGRPESLHLHFATRVQA